MLKISSITKLPTKNNSIDAILVINKLLSPKLTTSNLNILSAIDQFPLKETAHHHTVWLLSVPSMIDGAEAINKSIQFCLLRDLWLVTKLLINNANKDLFLEP